MAIGSRRTTPTAPVAAAVVSLDSVAPGTPHAANPAPGPLVAPCPPDATEDDGVDRDSGRIDVLGREDRALCQGVQNRLFG